MEDISVSADGLLISLRRADADLSAVMHRLESEFQHRFPEEVFTCFGRSDLSFYHSNIEGACRQ